MNWEEWVNEVKRIFIEDFDFEIDAVEGIDWEAMRDYFDDGASPMETVEDELYYSQ